MKREAGQDEQDGEDEPAKPEAPAAAPSERGGLVVRPGLFLTAVILSAFGAGLVIYWLLRSMRI